MGNERFEEIKNKYKKSNKYMLCVSYEDIGILIQIIEKQSKEIERIIERLEAKPYTAYTLYGDILHESDEIARMLKEIIDKL